MCLSIYFCKGFPKRIVLTLVYFFSSVKKIYLVSSFVLFTKEFRNLNRSNVEIWTDTFFLQLNGKYLSINCSMEKGDSTCFGFWKLSFLKFPVVAQQRYYSGYHIFSQKLAIWQKHEITFCVDGIMPWNVFLFNALSIFLFLFLVLPNGPPGIFRI